MSKAARGGIYPGWIVLAAVFTSAMLVIGGSIYIYQLFVIPVTEDLGISRGEASNAYVAMLVGIAVWSPIAGRLYDRMSAKLLMTLGGLFYLFGMAALSMLDSPVLMLLAVFILLGLAMGLAGGLAANTITARWFERRRGRALGIASIASSAGGFVMIPIMRVLIDNFEWRGAVLAAGLGVGAIIVALALFVVRDRPEEAQLANWNEAQLAPDETSGAAEWTFLRLIRSRQFWLITLCLGLLLASDQAVLSTQAAYLNDIGFSDWSAATIATGMTGSAIAGKLLVGFLAERYDIRWLFALVALFHAGLLGVFLLQPGFWPMLVFVSLFGAAVGGVYPVWSVFVSQNFGSASFGTAFGAMAMFTQALAIVFVAYIGRSFDATGSYLSAYTLFLGAIAIALVAAALIRRTSP